MTASTEQAPAGHPLGQNHGTALATRRGRTALWLRWVAANAVAELVGLGGVALLGMYGVGATGAEPFRPLAFAATMIVVGTMLEGGVVGAAQWLVLRRALPGISARSWIVATGLGALMAWTLGMLPSTMMDFGAAGAPQPAVEPSPALRAGLAGALGLVAGSILAAPQWSVLRRHVAHAGRRIPANAAAWAAGMVIVFAGAGSIQSGDLDAAIWGVALTCVAAGAVVGAVHGAVLVFLVRSPRHEPT